MSTVRQRDEVETKYTWNLTDLYPDDEAWENAYENVSERVDDLAAYQGQVTESAATLLNILEVREDIMRTVANISTYATLRRDEDTTNQQYQGLAARAQSLVAQANSAASFIEPELQESDVETLDAFIDDEPALAEYEHYFDDVLRQKEHTRSAEVEALLADLGEVLGGSSDVYNMLTNADMEFPSVDIEGEPTQITLSNFTTLQKNPNRDVRHDVYTTFYDEWETYRNSIAAAYKTSVKADTKLAVAREYGSAREAALDGPNIPVEVYDTLVDTIEDNLDVLHRHVAIKRDALGVEDLQMWDVYAPMSTGESPTIPYDEAVGYVVNAVAPLGEAYQERMEEGLETRWVDVYETENKRSGAYSSGTYDSQPYILMNYQDDITSMFTLAHELGHSMHSELAKDEQPYIYAGYEIFLAEIASTVNEALLTRYLLDQIEDPQFRSHLLDEYLERFRSTLFRQTMFASFEHLAHEIDAKGEALTPDRLDEEYQTLKEQYYAPAIVEGRIAREWMRIPHFYRAYYVYQYATGIAAANAIVDRIMTEGETAAEDYRSFLAAGSNGYPLDILSITGVDMTSPDPIDAAVNAYDELLSEFEAIQ